METWRCATLEGSNIYNALVFFEHVLQRVGYLRCLLNTSTGWEIHLYGKLVTVGNRHQLHRYLGEQHGTDDESSQSHTDSSPGVTEAPCQQNLVVLVHDVKQVERLFTVFRLSSLNGLSDEEVLQDRQQRLCNNH